MSIRPLPALDGALAARADSDIAPDTLKRWNANIQAAEQDDPDTTIAVLGIIGESFWDEGVTAKRISAALRAAGRRDVTVNVNSPGGNFMEGVAIYNLLRQHPGKVTVKVLGIAASAASLIAMAGDQIEIAKAGFVMIHNTHVGAFADRNGHREIADKLEIFDGTVAALYADRTGLDRADLAKMMDDETYLDGLMAVEKGFADALLPDDAFKEEVQNRGGLPANAAAHRLDVIMAQQGISRTERRKLLRDFKAGMPGAAASDTPRAVDPADVDNDGTAALSLGLARLKLARA